MHARLDNRPIQRKRRTVVLALAAVLNAIVLIWLGWSLCGLSRQAGMAAEGGQQQTMFHLGSAMLLIPLWIVGWLVAFRAVGRWHARFAEEASRLTEQAQRAREEAEQAGETLCKEIVDRRRAEDSVRQQTDQLNKRIRELDCLHAISRLLEDPDVSVEKVMQEAVCRVPSAWQYPETTCARIVLEGRVFQTANFAETLWKQSSSMMIRNRLLGALEVCYLEEHPSDMEGPFSKEERSLIDSIAEHLAKVADRKRAETQLALAKKQAEAAHHTRNEFLANMSHEIRTPMTAILGFTDVVLENLQQPEAIEAVSTVKRNGEHLLAMLNNILDLSKIDAGMLEIERIPSAPLRILAEVTSLMRVCADSKGLALTFECADPIPETIITDPARLQQILTNLIGNAIKFTEVGHVQVVARVGESEDCEPRLQFDVIDTGPGIDGSQIDMLFQPFTQVDNSMSRRFGGSGLGLAICRRLAQMLGGDISVISTPRKGSTFSVTIATGPLEGIPRVDHCAEAAAAVRQTAVAVAQNQVRLDGRILLVEDGPDNQRLVSFILRKAGAEVTLAKNGREAVEAALATYPGFGRRHDDCTEPFDLILMDMQMPVMDGYQATRQLRQSGYTGPIVALTAHAMQSDCRKCLEVGCDDHVAKPLDREKLLQTAATYMARQREVVGNG